MATDANESLSMLSRIEEQIPQDNVRLKTYVQALKEQLESQTRLWESKEEELSQFREAYEKLTQPANRIGVYLKPFENNAVILLGDRLCHHWTRSGNHDRCSCESCRKHH